MKTNTVDEALIKSKKILFLSTLIVVLLIFLDQYTKLLVTNNLKDKANFVIIKGVLELSYVKNTGAAFSFMGAHASIFRIIMGIITPVFCIALIYLMIKIPKNKNQAPIYVVLLFILSGAIGNYIDRMAHGFVVDFIYFSLINFPVFNVADIYITCSFAVMLYMIAFKMKDEDFGWLTQKK